MLKPYKFLALLIVNFFYLHPAHAELIQSEQHDFNIDIITEGLKHPWGMAFLADGDLLITERGGRLRMIKAGRLLEAPITGLPRIKEHGQGGLMGIALHPKFKENRWVYLAYAGKGKEGYGTEVIRGKLNGSELTDIETLFQALPKSNGGRHFGSRLLFAPDGTLFITLGERGDKQRAQDLNDHAGSLIRINADGTIPNNNPFINREDARPEIYTYGNRNIQGIALLPGSDRIWTHEHGPQGGDEVNIMRAGANYGWPVITFGVNYVIGTKIGEGTHKAGMEQPVHKWVPSIAPSGMTFYHGDKFPNWRGDLFVGSLKFGLLVRLEVADDKIVHEERMLNGKYGRIRDVVQGPNDLLYLLTDERNGKLLRITPSN